MINQKKSFLNKITAKEWIFPTVFILLLLILSALHSKVNLLLRYSREEIAQGEIWRLFTDHYVHLNLNHGLMNCMGFAMGLFIMGSAYSVRRWVFSITLIGCLLSLCLYFFSPQVEWYVGFSGPLHGVLALGFLPFAFKKDFLFIAAYILLIAKVVREQMPAFDKSHLMEIIHANVVVDAHLYGLLLGSFLAVIYFFMDRKNTL